MITETAQYSFRTEQEVKEAIRLLEMDKGFHVNQVIGSKDRFDYVVFHYSTRSSTDEAQVATITLNSRGARVTGHEETISLVERELSKIGDLWRQPEAEYHD